MKLCSKCNNDKPLNEFFKDSSTKSGLHSQCKFCMKLPKGSRSEYRKEHYQLNKEHAEKTRRKYITSEHGIFKRRDNWYRKNYGITLADYNKILLEQNNKCATCKRDKSESFRNLVVDHCHITNKIRGLLCDNCNVALGKIKDNVETLKTMIKYLGKI